MVESVSSKLGHQIHLFLSHAHVDNDTAEKTHRGWISQFDLSLTIELKQRGLLDVDLWRDIRDIPDHKRFGPEIQEGLNNAKLLLSVLSPVYIQRPHCMDELRYFIQKSGNDAVDRIFKVVKRWRNTFEEPHPLRDRIGYRFFEIDPESEREIPYYDPGRGTRSEYWDIMGRLADDIAAVLQKPSCVQLEEESNPFFEATVFLAVATKDLAEQHWQLTHELKRHQVRVVPDFQASVPTEAADVERVLAEALHDADFAIHLLGKTPGFTPNAANAPIAKLQLDATAAAKSAKHKGFHRLIWLSPEPDGRNVEQQRLIEALRSGSQLLADDELVEEGFEQLKVLVRDRIERLIGREPSPGRGTNARVYVMCDAPDIELAEQVADILAASGCDTVTPVVEGTSKSREEFDFYTLRTCHAALVVFGEATELWVRQTLDRLESWTSFQRQRPFEARAVLLGPPEISSKRRFRPTNADLVIPAIDALNRDRLMAFLLRLGEG